VWATQGFDVATTLNLFEAWATSLSYTFQLYFDFSGYTDMAIGLALLFNIRLPVNFNSPYKATNIQDFWRRWHMTLSRFMRDYLYIPLGGNKKGKFMTYNNLMATFVIGGLWHGAGWTFVFWGFLHGLALSIQKLWGNLGFKLWTWLAWLITFNFVNIAWVFFRAKEWDDAVRVLSGMTSIENIVLPNPLINKLDFLTPYGVKFGGWLVNITPLYGGRLLIPSLVIGFLITLFFKKTDDFKLNYKLAIFSGFLFIISILSLYRVSEFLYFNF
jgi:D-alanyl-lipoteichoic acid acyltransferase DltB (MBOAT superfamily)